MTFIIQHVLYAVANKLRATTIKTNIFSNYRTYYTCWCLTVDKKYWLKVCESCVVIMYLAGFTRTSTCFFMEQVVQLYVLKLTVSFWLQDMHNSSLTRGCMLLLLTTCVVITLQSDQINSGRNIQRVSRQVSTSSFQKCRYIRAINLARRSYVFTSNVC